MEPEPLAPSKPRLRGRFHQVALVVAVPAGAYLVATAPPGWVRVAMTVYALSVIGLFGASAAYHRMQWSPRALRRIRIVDHSMIFLLIAGTHTALAALVLDGLLRAIVLPIVWIGAVVGIVLKFVRIDGFSRVGGTLYIVLGWIGIVSLPQVLSGSKTLPLLLTIAGGLMYTGGAVVLLRRRPDPNPRVFGYHEVWHAFVVAASSCHYVAITMLLRAGA